MNNFVPKTRLEKILCNVASTAKTRLEKAVQIAVANAVSGGGQPGAVSITVSDDGEGLQRLTLDKTAAELFAMIQTGKKIRVNIVTPSESVTDVTFTRYMSIDGQAVDTGGGTVYKFSFVDVDSDDGVVGFATSSIATDDVVVFTKLSV